LPAAWLALLLNLKSQASSGSNRRSEGAAFQQLETPRSRD
jgi:hypothetical protein